MALRFTIQDFTSGSQVDTLIHEPVGLDKVDIHIARDKKYHGFLDRIEGSADALQYYGDGMVILKNAYDNYGLEAQVKFLIEFDCADTGLYDELYAGQYSFDTYKLVQGAAGCYVVCRIVSDAMRDFKNRVDQTVALDSLSTFDQGSGALAKYDNLGLSVDLIPKKVKLQNYAQYRSPRPDVYLDSAPDEVLHQNNIFVLIFDQFYLSPFGHVINEELPEFPGGVGNLIPHGPYDTDTTDADYIFKYIPENDYTDNTVHVQINLNMLLYTDSVHNHIKIQAFLFRGIDYNTAKSNPVNDLNFSNRLIFDGILDNDVSAFSDPPGTPPRYADFRTPNWSCDQYVEMKRGEKLFLNFQVETNGGAVRLYFLSGRYTTIDRALENQSYPNADQNFTVDVEPSYCKISLLSNVSATRSKVYMINEALSRAAEIITDDELRVYSDFFGRTDAQPYTSDADGEGSLFAISNGLLIRNYSPLVGYKLQQGSYTTNDQIGTSYTLVIGDAENVVTMNNAAANTITIPPHSSVAFATGARIVIQQIGEGVTSIAGGAGVTITSPAGGLSTFGPDSAILLTCVNTDEWLISTDSPMFVSFRDMLDSLSAIYAVGMGIEEDTERAGKNRLRIEPIEYFYPDDVIMVCENVETVELDVDPANMVNSLNIGYRKWEAEASNGLDEFLTKRSYRTVLSQVKTAVDKLSSIVASGYAIESTRRKSLITNTTDWRYDNDIFAICLNRNIGGYGAAAGAIGIDSTTGAIVSIDVQAPGRGYTIAPTITISGGGGSGATAVATVAAGRLTAIEIPTGGGGSGYGPGVSVTITPNLASDALPYVVEQENITNAANIIDPSSVYNYRISPARNALRWLRWILQSITDYATVRLYFMGGDGNYIASGKNNISPVIENDVLLECKDLQLSDLADSTKVPLFRNETVKFKYPLSYSQWKDVDDNKYGLIGYSVNEGSIRYGWIQDLKYSPYEGIAEFTLKPKI